jgi:hypothetical protein
MALTYSSTYNPFKDSSSSGSEVTDLNPERAYSTDLRRVDEDVRGSLRQLDSKQVNIGKFFKAARLANKYRQQAQIGGADDDFPGDTFGPVGSSSYSKKPKTKNPFV